MTWRAVAALRARPEPAEELDPAARGAWPRVEPDGDPERASATSPPSAPQPEVDPGARAAWRAWLLLAVAVLVRAPGPYLGHGLDQYAAFMRLS